jgi:DHA1 family multidrug resistance protein-like MFS transporter
VSVQIAVDFNVSNEVSYLVTSLFLCGYILGPILWGPGSELLGRRLIFVITMMTFTLLHLGQSLAPNIQTLLVTRFLSGVFGAGPLSTWGGMSIESCR